MIVLFVLLLSLLLYRAIGALGVVALATWVGATRYALATMLVFTASAHFTKMKHDLARMMPDWIPRPMALIYFTGLCAARARFVVRTVEIGVSFRSVLTQRAMNGIGLHF